MVFEHDYKNFPELSNRQIEEFGFSSPHKQYTEDFDAFVVRVHDGDTITLRTPERDFTFEVDTTQPANTDITMDVFGSHTGEFTGEEIFIVKGLEPPATHVRRPAARRGPPPHPLHRRPAVLGHHRRLRRRKHFGQRGPLRHLLRPGRLPRRI